MLNNKTIAVVVPAYNEGKQIEMVLRNMPGFVDRIIVVNDASTDETGKIVREVADSDDKDHSSDRIGQLKIKSDLYNQAEIMMEKLDKERSKALTASDIWNKSPEKNRIILIEHQENAGVGAAIATGYNWCRDNNVDCTTVMAGDGQMDPAELKSICLPVVKDGIDYVKGNRLIHRSAKYMIPKTRYIGNSILSIMTKIASGYWRVSDTQTGYTAISLHALKKIDISRIYKRYGMPNDLLVKLNLAKCTLKEVEIKPVYRVGEQSKMKIYKLIPRISWLLYKAFYKRIWIRYFKKDFHPLFLLYMLSFVLFAVSIPFLVIILENMFTPGAATPNSILMIYIFLVISGFQSLFFAMWMDIQDNDRLQK
ncbi:MAG: glycosyltransferase family 2 protein [Bacteroidales bacterium]|nr:glycosyltransferase family 2 protein [Bacteroidales bacterium]